MKARRERRDNYGEMGGVHRILGNGFVMLHFAKSELHSTYRPAPSSLGPRTLKNLELESSRLEASADCRIQGDIYRLAL